ncbi:MAG: choice-of-anchor D domain-containing protein [Deltaproteobacteria bacterium]|nr:choice-of-anchor D domain-containing protein [Deltaproteobacteria bacterium]
MRRLALQVLLPLLAPVVACDCDQGVLEVSAKLEVTPEVLDFGDVPVGGQRLMAASLGNGGQLGIVVDEVKVVGPTVMTLASVAPERLVGGAAVDLNVAFEPIAVGLVEATLQITTDAGSAQVILRGRGVLGGAGVVGEGEGCGGAGPSVAFGEVAPGTTVTRSVTITSTGSAPLTVLSAVREVGTTPELEIDDVPAPVVLGPGESLTLEARYTPVDGGADVGAFVLTTDLPQPIRVAACGAAAVPAVCVTPDPLDLGLVAVGDTARARWTVTSCGRRPLQISALALSSDAAHPTAPGFALPTPPAAPLTLDVGQSVEVEVSYSATAPASAQGWLRVGSDAYMQPEAFAAVTARSALPCDLQVLPASLTYFDVEVGANATKHVLISNNGARTCDLTALRLASAEFALVSPPAWPSQMGPGQSQVLAVRYAPGDPGPHQATLEVEAGGAVHPVTLLGNPSDVSGCVPDVEPTYVRFGAVALGSRRLSAVLVRNRGDAVCRLRSSTLQDGEPSFSVVPPLTGLILPQVGRAEVEVIFEPQTAAFHRDVLVLEVGPTNGPTTTFLVPIVGTSAAPRICVSPTTLDFGVVPAGSSAQASVSISNCGGAELDLQGILLAPEGDDAFSVSMPSLPVRLAAGSTLAPAVTVTYAPVDSGPHAGRLDVLSTDPADPWVPVMLAGNRDPGCTKVLRCRPTLAAFGRTEVGVEKIRQITCANLGTDPVTIQSATLQGDPSFTVRASTPAVLQPGQSWSAELRYAPVGPGNHNVALRLVHDACQGPAQIGVSGIGEVQMPPCQPPPVFQPVVQWEWHGSPVEPTFRNVWMTPIVANMTDDNADGVIDENDVPDVLVVTFDRLPITAPNESEPGILRVLSGDDGHEHFSVLAPRIAESAQLAVGDIDGDGFPEIIASKWTVTPTTGTGIGGYEGRYTEGRLVALDHLGHQLWESEPYAWPSSVLWNASAPVLADLDADGFSEIILGREVFDHRGRILWRGQGSLGLTQAGPNSVVADIDLDGQQEVIAGDTVYRADGSILWQSGEGEGGVSVGMLDPLDPYPQIVLQTGYLLRVFDHLGMRKWTVQLPTAGPTAQLPALADYDGDGDTDIAVADGEAIYVYTGDGSPIWTGTVMDSTCCAGISAFDFEGDGAAELLWNASEVAISTGTGWAYHAGGSTPPTSRSRWWRTWTTTGRPRWWWRSTTSSGPRAEWSFTRTWATRGCRPHASGTSRPSTSATCTSRGRSLACRPRCPRPHACFAAPPPDASSPALSQDVPVETRPVLEDRLQ